MTQILTANIGGNNGNVAIKAAAASAAAHGVMAQCW